MVSFKAGIPLGVDDEGAGSNTFETILTFEPDAIGLESRFGVVASLISTLLTI